MKAVCCGMLIVLFAGCGDTQPVSQRAITLALQVQETGIAPDLELAAQLEDALNRADDQISVKLDCAIPSASFELKSLSLTAVEEPAYSTWASGSLVTGDDELDALIVEHKVVSVQHFTGALEKFTVTLSSPARTDRLVEALVELDAIGAGSTIPVDGISSNIELTVNADSWELLFWFGWGDCLSGCINQHAWRTRVPFEEERAAELLQEYGDAIPPQLKQMCLKP